MSLHVNIDEIPTRGLDLQGQVDHDIFGLDDKATSPDGPVRYRLHLTLDDGQLLVHGTLAAPFELECTRCLEPFPFLAEVPDFNAEIPAEKGPIIDLTDQIREDILLALPGYPKCEQSTGAGRTCPQRDRFSGTAPAHDGQAGNDDDENTRNIWGALDQLDPRREDEN